jgi:hypothetical protein
VRRQRLSDVLGERPRRLVVEGTRSLTFTGPANMG